MANFSVAVSEYMTTPVLTVKASTPLSEADALMRDRGVSSLAVVSDEGALDGILSRTDLLRVGSRQAGRRKGASLLTYPPSATVGDAMTKDVEAVEADLTCAEAAALMVKKRFHRLLVRLDGELVGVASTFDLMQLVVDQKLNKPVSEYMSSPLFTVRVDEPISLATERLERAKVTGLVVLDGDWPVGLFTQTEALESRDAERDTPIESVMGTAFLSLEAETPIHRAAAMAVSLGARRVVTMTNGRPKGILTGLDFAKAVAG
jgi:CBS domain-containing protein